MKLFISADIEGCAGLSFVDETHKTESPYQRYAEQMTHEVLAVCEAAHNSGATEIVVKDGHGDASNINPLAMPSYVTLIRGKSGHPYNMMYGLDETFDAVLYVGYHAAAGNTGFSISHTSTGNSQSIRLNNQEMSEFLLNTYTAASLHVPVIFLSGDSAICQSAAETIPGIHTAITKRGEGGATWCEPPQTVTERLQNRVSAAVSELQTSVSAIAAASAGHIETSGFSPAPFTLPDTFTYEVTFKDWKKAYQMSFYPGMNQIDRFTIRLVSNRWLDIVTAHSFVVY